VRTTPTFGRLELLGLIEDYRQGLVPLIVPLTLLKHHRNRHPVPEWVHQQVYLNPYPKELMLRNHVLYWTSTNQSAFRLQLANLCQKLKLRHLTAGTVVLHLESMTEMQPRPTPRAVDEHARLAQGLTHATCQAIAGHDDTGLIACWVAHLVVESFASSSCTPQVR